MSNMILRRSFQNISKDGLLLNSDLMDESLEREVNQPVNLVVKVENTTSERGNNRSHSMKRNKSSFVDKGFNKSLVA